MYVCVRMYVRVCLCSPVSNNFRPPGARSPATRPGSPWSIPRCPLRPRTHPTARDPHTRSGASVKIHCEFFFLLSVHRQFEVRNDRMGHLSHFSPLRPSPLLSPQFFESSSFGFVNCIAPSFSLLGTGPSFFLPPTWGSPFFCHPADRQKRAREGMLSPPKGVNASNQSVFSGHTP